MDRKAQWDKKQMELQKRNKEPRKQARNMSNSKIKSRRKRKRKSKVNGKDRYVRKASW